MAKKNIKKTDEPVAKCDQFEITNCDIKNIRTENLIRTIRGQQVMLDSDLAMLYGVKNKRLNEQVKHNMDSFPDDFMFQLTKQDNDQYREINLKQLPHRDHDRFLIIDSDVYLLGASVKDMGIGLSAITKMQTSPDTYYKC